MGAWRVWIGKRNDELTAKETIYDSTRSPFITKSATINTLNITFFVIFYIFVFRNKHTQRPKYKTTFLEKKRNRQSDDGMGETLLVYVRATFFHFLSTKSNNHSLEILSKVPTNCPKNKSHFEKRNFFQFRIFEIATGCDTTKPFFFEWRLWEIVIWVL